MSLRFLIKLLAPLPLLVLSACSSIAPDFTDMASSYQKVIEKYNADNILLNIVRASKERPTGFLEIPTIQGTGTITTSPSLSVTLGSLGASAASLFAVTTGSGATIGAPIPSISRSFSFTQSSLDNATFLNGFLAPIPAATLNYFSSVQAPREIIFILSIDAIKIYSPDGTVREYRNEPKDPKYPEFMTVFQSLIDSGLSTQTLIRNTPLGPPMSELAAAQFMPTFLNAKDKQNLTMEEIVDPKAKPGSPKFFQVYQSVPVSQVCIQRNERSADVEKRFGPSYFCLNSDEAQKFRNNELMMDPGNSDKKYSRISIQIRSNRGIYDFLGNLINEQDPTKPYLIRARSLRDGQFQVMPLFVVEKNSTNPGNTLSTVVYDGVTYTIPGSNNGYTTMVMNILTQLLTLNKVSGTIPPSPAVLIRN
jgi:hypothetical protein